MALQYCLCLTIQLLGEKLPKAIKISLLLYNYRLYRGGACIAIFYSGDLDQNIWNLLKLEILNRRVLGFRVDWIIFILASGSIKTKNINCILIFVGITLLKI